LFRAKLSAPVATPAVYPELEPQTCVRNVLRSFTGATLHSKVKGLSTRLTAVLELDRTELGRDYSQVALFKRHLMSDPTGNRILSDATVNRTLGTLKNFYGWLFRLQYVSRDPTTEVDRPKLKEPTAQNLKPESWS